MVKGTMELEKKDQDEQGEIPLHVQVCEEEEIKGKMKPQRIALQSSLAGTGVREPEQPRLSYREMLQIVVGHCTHACGSFGPVRIRHCRGKARQTNFTILHILRTCDFADELTTGREGGVEQRSK